jgi:general secretion pathway protein C
MNVDVLGSDALKNLKYIFYLILVTMAVYTLSTVVLFVLDLKMVNVVPPAQVVANGSAQRATRDKPLNAYRSIWERNLFAVTVDEDEQRRAESLAAKIDQLSLTSLNCTLIGTIINEGGDSWAIIRDNQSKRQDKYTVGATIRGAKVRMILRNKVVLNINGKDELLVMGIERIRAEGPGDRKVGVAKGSGDTSTYNISKNLVQNSINNVAEIMSKVRIKPHFKDGEPDGFRISRIKQGSIFKTMGFKSGDVIKSVNGQPVQTAEDIMRLYETMKDSSYFNIGITRDNQEKTLNFKVR